MAGTKPRYTLAEITDEPQCSDRVVIAPGLELSTIVVPVSCFEEAGQLCRDDLTVRTILGCRYGGDYKQVEVVTLERVFAEEHRPLYERLQQWVLAEWQARTGGIGATPCLSICNWIGKIKLVVSADFPETVCPLTGHLFDDRYFDSSGLLWSLPRRLPEAAHLVATGQADSTPGDGQGNWFHDQRGIRDVEIPLLVLWDATPYTNSANITTCAYCPPGTSAWSEGLRKLVFGAEMQNRIHVQRRPPGP